MSRLVLSGIASAALTFGQAVNGSISGIISDHSGALVAGAKVTVMDQDRNTVFTASSNETGLYVVPQLPIGKYRVTVEKTGFRPDVLEGFAAEQHASVSVTLEVGSTSSGLTVTGAPQLVEAITGTLSAVVSNNRIVDLPLNDRSIYGLTSLVPGVFQSKTTTGVDDTFYGNHFIINGGQEATSDMVLDGVSAEVNHNVPTNPAITAIPSVEGIREFRILTNADPAEYGGSGGRPS
jgi:hypothetical protein